MNGRPLARLIATLALLVLGAFALARLPLDYLPQRSFPELTVGLALGEDRDPGEVTRDWVEPVESAVRSLGPGARHGRRGADGRRRSSPCASPPAPIRSARRRGSTRSSPACAPDSPRGPASGSIPPPTGGGLPCPDLALRRARRRRRPGRGRGAARGAGGAGASSPSACRDEEMRISSRRPRSIPGESPAPCSPRPGGRCACRPSAGAARGTACGRWCRRPRPASRACRSPAGARCRASRLPGHAPRPQPAGAGRAALPRRARPGPLRLSRARRAAARPRRRPAAAARPAPRRRARRDRLERGDAPARAGLAARPGGPARLGCSRPWPALGSPAAGAPSPSASPSPRPWPPPPTPSCWRASP